jgi:hypothetical protein
MRHTILPVLMTVMLAAAITGCRQDEKQGHDPEPTVALPASTTTTVDPVRVQVTLIGLCTIADASVAGETAKQTAILANYKDHFASFVVHEDNLDSKDGFTQLKDPKGALSKFWAYPLKGIQLELNTDTDAWDGGTVVSYSTAGDSNNAMYPDVTGAGQNDASIHWIPSMTRILGTSAAVRLRFVKPEPSETDVHVRMPMRGGTLESSLDHPYYLWSFRTIANVYKQVQVVADQIHYSFPLKIDETTKMPKTRFTVYGRKFATSDPPDAPAALFTIKTAAATDRQIEIYLGNLPADGFFAEDKRARGYKDPHFHLHYSMIDGGPPHYEPVIIGQMLGGAGPLGSTAYCGSDRLP